jgi:uncharacterized protein (TIGR00369 family)
MLNPEHLSAVARAINNCPFFKHMSMEILEIGNGFSVVAAQIQREHMNPFGGLHGGVYASVIDTAAYWSVYGDLPEENGLVTIDLNVDLLAPAGDGRILVKGKKIKTGKTLALAEAEMFDGKGKLLAHGSSKLMVTRNKQSMHDVVGYLKVAEMPVKFLED